jgi:hypothetical protein
MEANIPCSVSNRPSLISDTVSCSLVTRDCAEQHMRQICVELGNGPDIPGKDSDVAGSAHLNLQPARLYPAASCKVPRGPAMKIPPVLVSMNRRRFADTIGFAQDEKGTKTLGLEWESLLRETLAY